MAAFYQCRHLTVEKGQQQRTNMRTIDVGVGHDDNAVITQFVGIELFSSNSTTHSGNQSTYFGGRKHFVESCFLDIKDLPFQRQNGLGTPVPALFCRTAGRVTLYKVEFGKRWVFFLAVCKFSR